MRSAQFRKQFRCQNEPFSFKIIRLKYVLALRNRKHMLLDLEELHIIHYGYIEMAISKETYMQLRCEIEMLFI